MKKAMRKMIPAVIMLLISAMLVGTSTYAWFSMNKTVTVTGMSVKAKGNDNVTISTDDVTYNFSIDQTRTGNLKPASSIDGVDYYYTSTANVNSVNGAAKSAVYAAYNESTSQAHNDAGKTNYDADFNTNYGITSVTTTTVVYGYIDYQFYINATNSSGSASQYLIMDKCNLLYNNAVVDANIKAWRVAVFAKPYNRGTDSASHDEVSTTYLKSILKQDGAGYHTTGSAVNSTSSVAAVNAAIDDAVVIDNNVSSGYYKVTVRLWLEGEDTTCKNDTFATLDNNWTLDLSFSLTDSTTSGTNAVTAIGSAKATAAAEGATGTATLSGASASTYQWYTVTGNAAVDGATNATYTKTGTGSADYYCVVTTATGISYQTNSITLTVSE